MFEKVLVAENIDFTYQAIRKELSELGVKEIHKVQHCDEAFLKLKVASRDNSPFDLLISDLLCEEGAIEQEISSGEEFIKLVRNEFPSLKIVVFSVEDKTYKIQILFNELNIDAFVHKNKNGVRELNEALHKIYNSDKFYISPHFIGKIAKSKAIQISEYNIFLIACISEGNSHSQIRTKLKEKEWTPTSISSIEKRLKFLREHFNATNPAHLVAIAKDLGLI